MLFFTKKHSAPAPLVIIKGGTAGIHGKEYTSIEEAIADLERDPNVPQKKIETLRSSLKCLKNKTSITIRNGEMMDSIQTNQTQQ